ncbi:MAG: hypothetical protein BRC38_15525 [Cyanobacteria bacterium QH_6_48_35]|nr:MAG: hypothetical protein BRC34_10915 [Cyanobacteria bacterium QH_1_48_107]PSO56543.1 MAG: hypothetical protein BRC39_17040 [Cyanobacteria bacterium QH_7_48_89]PSO62548.1 MAG: hypothetical protein BRC38_15525 [Cyanobacteria bacterium QH_6_48_35]
MATLLYRKAVSHCLYCRPPAIATFDGLHVFNPADLSKGELLGLVLLATLIGTALVLCLLYELLKPVLLAKKALQVYFDQGEVLKLPTDLRDEVGSLLCNVAYSIKTFESRRVMLEEIAVRDCLSGLLNRRAAEERLQQSLKLAKRNQFPLSIASDRGCRLLQAD